MDLNIIPTPKSVFGGSGVVFAPPVLRRGDFDNEAELFACRFEKAHGIALPFSDEGSGGIFTGLHSGLAPEEFRLECEGEAVTVYASSPSGAAGGFNALLQMSEVRDGKLLLPDVTLCDRPDWDYRGLLIDCARSFHTVEELKNYIELCSIYRVRYLHLHLTDDESYTLPSKLFPKLTSEKNSYSVEDIRELEAFAARRHVELIPEIDTPGHSTVLRRAYPEIFEAEDSGIMRFSKESTKACADLYKEVCTMFPASRYIHIGGDEPILGRWLECEKSMAYAKECGITFDEGHAIPGREYFMLAILAHFIKSNAEAVLSCGKTPIVWEGFHKSTNCLIPKETLVMVFESLYQLPCELMDAGFKVINCSWRPTYLVVPAWKFSTRHAFDWDCGSYSAVCRNSPYRDGFMRFERSPLMQGGQFNSWGDTIEKDYPTVADGHRDELASIRERLPYICENQWNYEKITTYAELGARIKRTDAILDKLLS